MFFMAMADELLTAYISLELLSFSSYILVSYAKRDLKSNEAGIKYLIIGGLSSALLLLWDQPALRRDRHDQVPGHRPSHSGARRPR